MSEVSSHRRRFGVAAITTTALALPLTASITYAQAEAPQDGVQEERTETVDADGNRQVRVIRWVGEHPEGAEAGEHAPGDHERHMQMHVIELGGVGPGEHADGEHRVIHRHIEGGEGMSEAEREALMAEIHSELEGLDDEVRREVHEAMAEAHAAMAEAGEQRRIVMRHGGPGSAALESECSGDEPVVRHELEDGRHMVMICQTAVHEQAAAGLREALQEIANDPEMPADIRERVTRELQRQIERMEGTAVSWQAWEGKVERAAFVPDAAAQAVAVRWTGRMVRPVPAPAPAPVPQPASFRLVVPVAPVAAPAPRATLSQLDADCDEAGVRA